MIILMIIISIIITMIIRVSITCACSMHLALFPLDEQKCDLDVASCELPVIFNVIFNAILNILLIIIDIV